MSKVIKTHVNSIALSTLLLVTLVSCQTGKQASYSSSYSSHSNSTSEAHTKKSPEATFKADKVIKEAKSYLGTHYKYGGTTRSGIDCSGLVCNSFKSVDITLPHSSAAIGEMGQEVKIGDLRKGDLLCFTDKKGNKKITHIGIVTEVENSKSIKFIHASTKAGVVEANLFSEFYISIFIKAVRIF